MTNGAPVRFVIFAAPRTGSNLLCSLLNSHPDILCHHGLFNPAGIHYALDHRSGDLNLGTTAERDRDPKGFLERVWQNHRGSCAIGFKFNLGENETAAQTVLRDPAVKKVLLNRRNRIKTYVSERIAIETELWESYEESAAPGWKVRVERDALMAHITRNRQYYAEIERALADSEQTFFKIEYERLAPDSGGLCELLSYLGCTPGVLTPGCSKRNPDDLREAISNFDELARHLQGTNLESELYQQDFAATLC